MKKSTTQTKVFSRDILFVYVLLGTIAILVCLYIYFLSASVSHVVMRSQAERSIGQAQSELSELETELMISQHRVSAEIANLDGYSEPKNRIFIDRSKESLVLRDSR